MSFTDYLFLPLFLLLTIVYFMVPIHKRWLVLLAASVFGLCTWGLELLPIALLIVFITWIAAVVMDMNYKKEQNVPAAKKKNKRILTVAIVAILFFLLYTKMQKLLVGWAWGSPLVWFTSRIYQNIINGLLKLPYISMLVRDVQSGNSDITYLFFTPLGISYYTMSLIGYLLDVYWRKERAEKNYCKLLLFAIYFPKVFQGPIARHKDLAGQLCEGHGFDYHRYCFGWQRMLWGYFKKLVIADRLSIFVNLVFGNYETYHGSQFLVAAVFGAFQLYCDFSGCMDIALGASQIFGIELAENFKRPFFSRSAAEFWRRWHITLGAWFKDYVYMPLVISPRLLAVSGKLRKSVGKRTGKAFITVIPLSVVWLLTGLWHGSGWNYIIWGIYWGILIIVSTVFEPEMKKFAGFAHINTESKGYILFRQFRTFLLFVISRIITIPSKLEATGDIFKKIFTDFAPWKLVDGSIYELVLDMANLSLPIILLVLLLFVSQKQESGVVIRERIEALPLIPRWIFWIAATFVVLIFGVYGVGYSASAFVYMNY